jgi:hypothetical protein
VLRGAEYRPFDDLRYVPERLVGRGNRLKMTEGPVVLRSFSSEKKQN